MSLNRFFRLLAFVLACVICGTLGGYIALRYSQTENEGQVVINSSHNLSDLEWMSILNQSMTKISEEVRPSIVGVISKSNQDNLESDSSDDEKKKDKNDSQDDEDTEIDLGTGSGIIIDKDGYILTNNHVVESADSVVVKLSSGKEVPAVIIGKDSRSDIAVLKINEDNLVAAKLGDSSLLKAGELAFAIGNPLGLELSGSITMGIISGTDRSLMVDGKRLDLIQTDAAINPGNSGGALVNVKGEVVGINTLKEFYAGSIAGLPIGVEGVGFAIPMNIASPLAKELIEQGYITRPGLGVTIVNGIIPEKENAPIGVLVDSVTKNGPADKAGILAGDLIISMQGTNVETYQELVDKINEHKIGDSVKITVWREEKEIKLTVILEQLPH